MALEVNPEVKPVQTPETQGVRPGNLHILARGSEGMKGLLEGAGKLVTGAGQLAENVTKDSAQNFASDAAEEYRKSVALDDAQSKILSNEYTPMVKGEDPTAVPGGEGEKDIFNPTKKGSPTGVSNFAAQLEKQKQVYDSGKYSDSYWNAWLQQKIQQVKAAHPGFEHVVDAVVEHNTGIRMADTQRRTMQREFDALQRQQNAQSNFENNYKKQNQGQIEFAFEQGMFKGYKNLGDVPFDMQVRAVGQIKAKQFGMELEHQSITLQSAKTKLGQENMGQIFDHDLGDIVSQHQNALYHSSGAGDHDAILKEAESQMEKTGAVDAKTANQLRMKAQTDEQALRIKLNKYFDTPQPNLKDENGHMMTYRQVYPPTLLKEKIDAAIANHNDTFWGPAFNKDWGVMHASKMVAEARTNADFAKLDSETGGVAQRLATIKEKLGPEALGLALTKANMVGKDGKPVPVLEGLLQMHIAAAVSDPPKGGAAPGMATIGGWSEADKRISKTAGTVAAIAPTNVRALTTAKVDVGIITNPKAEIAGRVNAVKNIYGGDNKQAPFLAQYHTKDQAVLYNTLFSHEVSDSVWELRSTDPKTWNAYTTAARRNLGNMFVEDEAVINGENSRATGKYTISFDQGSGRFKADQRPEAVQAAKQRHDFQNSFFSDRDPAIQAVNRLNAGLELLDYIRQKEGGKSVSADFLPQQGEEMQTTLRGGQVERSDPEGHALKAIATVLHNMAYLDPADDQFGGLPLASPGLTDQPEGEKEKAPGEGGSKEKK